ncbi:aminotransferase class V-fold PLP-dependent enzyme [Candidatus Lucifugimonas marina]|jgi:L-seryl-tRNA(Ser) seleniumtransferase|uniref:Aminotransferase class V-fold PLP-dependent enzyme n=1 Tax=Candidatus Lucifugimonas marina TaxID=3038979 RepID=A0AAJ6CQW4_9CHLR|nr:aminotransferase class V-fold PLP-dependent enzyme [SAR202 cluster bacterium JH702]MDG0870876.1 aminotransferase class V-fold PLP-dependent enzyme [SAR202 cluster bacterium JH639]WFG34764.1 aminotransferase class V-fold PLP-dependent enzyme [SAR202 cluster bacterium JH545]WFG38691.1 aminotransferase class V-fold PLP-dependent enzyme [SAR202 cluster bacterium JH1073]
MVSSPQNNPVYARFGVTPVINAGGTHTTHGGSMMRQEVRDAMSLASESFVDLVELKRATGSFVAEITGAEAGLICSGAAGGLVLATAAVMTGTDAAKIAQLPNTDGLKNEILTQASNPEGYLKCHEYAGATLTFAGDENGATADQLREAIGDRTAAVLYTYAYGSARGGLSAPEVADIAHAAGIPLIVDGAAMLPPKSNLTKYISEGADLVTFSGGKYIGGPQSAGLLAGKTDLIEAALENSGPSMAIGRPQKVGREEMIGMATALQLFIETDDSSRMDEMFKQAEHIASALNEVAGVSAEVKLDGLSYHVPNCVITLEGGQAEIDRVWEEMHEGSPRVYVARNHGGLAANMVNVSPGQEKVVAERLVAALGR